MGCATFPQNTLLFIANPFLVNHHRFLYLPEQSHFFAHVIPYPTNNFSQDFHVVTVGSNLHNLCSPSHRHNSISEDIIQHPLANQRSDALSFMSMLHERVENIVPTKHKDASSTSTYQHCTQRRVFLKILLAIFFGFFASSSSLSRKALADAQNDLLDSGGNFSSFGLGGPGGQLKKSSDTGIYRTGRINADSRKGIFLDELLAYNGTPILISFRYPPAWSLTLRGALCVDLEKSICRSGAIDVRNFNAGDGAFIVTTPLFIDDGTMDSSSSITMNDIKDLAKVDRNFVLTKIFSKEGKYGAYGSVEDLKVIKDTTINQASTTPALSNAQINPVIYQKRLLECKFMALTPAMRSVEKRCVIAFKLLADDFFMIVATCNATRWTKVKEQLYEIADSFNAIEAPTVAKKKSNSSDDDDDLDNDF